MRMDDERGCPHCAGVIKIEAKLCKHCRRTVQPEPLPQGDSMLGGSSLVAGDGGDPSGVLAALKVVLISRGTLSRKELTEAFDESHHVDADEFLGFLHERGLLTQSQSENLKAVFGEAQEETARRIARAFVDRGLVSGDDARSALESYDRWKTRKTFYSHLVDRGLITVSQARAAAKEGASARQPDQTGARPPGRKKAAAGVAVGALVGVGVFLYLGLSKDGEAAREELRPECTMNGAGKGTCVFSNIGPETQSGCGSIVVKCEGNADYKKSVKFCSGEIGRNETRQVEFVVAEMDRITPRYGDWRDSCNFIWVSAGDLAALQSD